jgi:hypothetical protein
MTEVYSKTGYTRLEDVVHLARAGKDVKVEVTLRKEIVAQKVHPEETETMKGEMNMCLLIGDYTCRVGDAEMNVSKVYMYYSAEERKEASRVDRNIANERLKMDYKRLKDAKIEFEEKFFE